MEDHPKCFITNSFALKEVKIISCNYSDLIFYGVVHKKMKGREFLYLFIGVINVVNFDEIGDGKIVGLVDSTWNGPHKYCSRSQLFIKLHLAS